jgi:hypothetical protein
MDLPKIEVRYHHLNVDVEAQSGSTATPSLPQFFLSLLQVRLPHLLSKSTFLLQKLGNLINLLLFSRFPYFKIYYIATFLVR